MRKLLFLFITAMSMGFISLKADQLVDKNTFLYLCSAKGNYVGQGETHLYEQNDGQFNIFINECQNLLKVSFESHNPYENVNWFMIIDTSAGQILKPGVYREIGSFGRTDDNISFHFSCCGRCSNSVSDIEILEFKVDNEGRLESFAINFIQHDGYEQLGPALFGSFRYNSSILVQANVSEIFDKFWPVTSFLYVKQNGYELKTSEDNLFKYAAYNDGEEERILVKIIPKVMKFCPFDVFPWEEEDAYGSDFYGSLELEFTKLKDGEIVASLTGNYLNDSTTKFSDYERPRFRVRLTEIGSSEYNEGEFKVLKIEKNSRDKINELALNFRVKNDNCGTLEGSLRYNTDIPVNLINPFEE